MSEDKEEINTEPGVGTAEKIALEAARVRKKTLSTKTSWCRGWSTYNQADGAGFY